MIKKNNIKKILEALEKEGTCRNDAAKLVGISRMSIYRYERGIYKPRAHIAKKILQISKHINHGLKLEDIV